MKVCKTSFKFVTGKQDVKNHMEKWVALGDTFVRGFLLLFYFTFDSYFF